MKTVKQQISRFFKAPMYFSWTFKALNFIFKFKDFQGLSRCMQTLTISSSKIPRIARVQHACRLWTQKIGIYNSRGPKQTWHQNEATPHDSKRNAPTREQMRLFASNIKELQRERIGAPSCGWISEGGTLPRLCSP